ncbi:unnamed protein product [Cunninghamella echinulata]
MLTQYINHFINNFDQKKTVDQLQKVVTSKEGAIGIATAVVLMAGVSFYKSTKFDRGCPRVPDSSFIYGSTMEYRKDPKAFLNKWRKELGDVYSARLFGEEIVVVSGHQVREVFLNKDFNFNEGIKRSFDTHLLTDSRQKDTHISPIGDATKQYLNPNLKHFTPYVIEALTQGFHEFSGDIPTEGKDYYHLYPMIQHMIAKASATVFVGTELSKNPQLIDTFKNMVAEVGSQVKVKPILELFPRISRLNMWYIGKTSPSIKKHRNQLYNVLKNEINRRLKEKEIAGDNWERPIDILQSLIESKEIPSHFDIYDYAMEMITLFIFAALHTTTENGTVAFYRIMSHPGLIDELLEEQNQVLESEGLDKNCGPEVFTREILNKFVKLDSAIREAFRVKNVYLDIPHINFGDKNIVLSSGAIIRPGEYVYVSTFTNNNDPEIQNSLDDLQEYKPLRFLNTGKISTKIGEDFLPFGQGPHACPGR